MSENLKLVPLPGARSKIWQHFGFQADASGIILNKKQVICKICKVSVGYSGNTTNLNSHLQVCTNVNINPSSSKTIISYFKDNNSKLSFKCKRSKELTKGLVKFVVKDLRPLSTVHGTGFLEFMKIAVLEYVVPSRQTITRLVDLTAQHERNNFRIFLENIPHVSLTLDFWTSASNHSYLGVTCHYLQDWCLRTRVLETMEVPESHTSVNIVNNLKYILKHWNIENKVCAFVCDNAANMVRAINDMGQSNLVRCAAHSVQLSVNAGLQHKEVNELINKLRKIVGHFNRSSTAQKELEDDQEKFGEKKTKLVQDCITRWNSTFDMVQSILKHKNSVNSVISKNKKINKWFITSDDFKNMKDLIYVLEPFKVVTETLGGENYTTASIVHRLIKSLLNNVQVHNSDTNFIKEVKTLISNDLNIRKELMGLVESKASALDPRFRDLKLLSTKQKQIVWKDLENEYKKMVPVKENKLNITSESEIESEEEDSPPPKRFRSLMVDSDDDDDKEDGKTLNPKSPIDELEAYKNIKTKIPYDQNPLSWWKKNETVYPTVSLLAKKYLSVVATSVPCERLFSEAGQVISQRRNRLSPDRVNQLLFLNSFFKSEAITESLMEKVLDEIGKNHNENEIAGDK